MSVNESIAYFAVLLDGPNSGAGKKVLDQVNSWRDKGFTATLYVISSESHRHEWEELEGVIVNTETRGINKLILRRKVISEINYMNPTILYVRDSFPFPFPNISKKTSAIIEVQTLLREEIKTRSKFRAALSAILDPFYLHAFTKYIFVSHEIARSSRFRKYLTSTNFKVISNGIMLERFRKLDVASISQKKELIFLGQNGQAWHGVNQIIELAGVLPELTFNIVGVTDNFVDAPSNVVFHGVLSQNEYRSIAQRSVAGVGTLNLRAKGMTEGSSLKVREYLAMGLPVFLRHSDTDFIDPPDFILELPDNQEPITNYVEQIMSFIQEWATKRVHRESISHIDMKEKESERLKFMLSNPTSS